MAKEEKEIKENKETSKKDVNVKKDEKKPEKGEKDQKRDKKAQKEAKLKEVRKETKEPKEAQPEIKHIVRIADTDLDGKRSVQYALIGIKGIGRRIAKIIAEDAGLDPNTTLGYIGEADIDKLRSSVGSIITTVPYWMVNKQNDYMTGEDKHNIGTDVQLSINEDINTAKKMRSYKGIRHERGLRVRGQRTRSTGRKGRTVGVTRATLAGAKAKEPAKEGEKKEEKKAGGK